MASTSSRGHRGRAADHADKIVPSFYFHPKHGKTVLWIVVGDTFDESVQGFGHDRESLLRLRRFLS